MPWKKIHILPSTQQILHFNGELSDSCHLCWVWNTRGGCVWHDLSNCGPAMRCPEGFLNIRCPLAPPLLRYLWSSSSKKSCSIRQINNIETGSVLWFLPPKFPAFSDALCDVCGVLLGENREGEMETPPLCPQQYFDLNSCLPNSAKCRIR